MTDKSTCPNVRDGDDEVARQWASGALSPEAAAEFEAHMRTCGHCQRVVEQSSGITAALRTAAASHVKRPSGQLPWTIAAIVVGVVLLWFAMRS